MAKVQTIRRRIKSVKNINQITKAMEMVSASKLRRAQESALRSRLYSSSAREALGYLRLMTKRNDHDLFARRKIKNRLIILFSSDRGLAGAYNSNLFRGFVDLLQRDREASPSIRNKVIVIGNKGADFVSKLNADIEIYGVYTNWPAHPTTVDLQPITQTVLRLFQEKEVDAVSVLFTDFVSMLKQVVTKRDVLPIDPKTILDEATISHNHLQDASFEPSPTQVLNFIVPRFIETQIYQANLEAIASEQAMRMMAMKNASDSAKDIISDLTLTYNGARQAAITQELAEITSGANAIS